SSRRLRRCRPTPPTDICSRSRVACSRCRGVAEVLPRRPSARTPEKALDALAKLAAERQGDIDRGADLAGLDAGEGRVGVADALCERPLAEARFGARSRDARAAFSLHC